MKLIDKDALVAEINKRIIDAPVNNIGHQRVWAYNDVKDIIGTLEVKTDEENSLEKFKSLQHITKDLHQTLEDWGYAPNLYFFDGMWHVSWISCEEGDGIKDFEGNTPEDAIDKAYNWFHSTFCNS